MTKPVKAIPEGMHSITPGLVIKGCGQAMDWYKKALGAVEIARAPDPTGKLVWHGMLRIGDSMIMMNDEMPEMGGKGPEMLGGSPVTLWLYADDIDATFARAVEHGATGIMPPMDMFWGDRMGKFRDPFGHEWALAKHIKDMTPEEMQKAQDEFVASMAKGGGRPE